MEADYRSFEPVKVDIINVESASDRFFKDHTGTLPEIAFWRVNLTALSQKYNLYFVASRTQIQVYRPEFPYQSLGDKPALTLVPQLANPEARGYIDTARPHSINHLIVGDLGSQEILLLSTDSGNIVAYYTSSINAATQKDAYSFSANGNADFVGVRSFFSQWVHESAWGLAIHKEGRMIAVSANIPKRVPCDDPSSKITVFAFALIPSVQETKENSSEAENATEQTNNSSEWKSWSSLAHQDTPRRDRNYKIVLGGKDGHINNVPCITFVNGPEDTTGSWLLSTDIEGQMKLWQIWRGKQYKSWNFIPRNTAATPWTMDREAGWLVAALDVNSFQPAKTMASFVGFDSARRYYGYNARGYSYDLTDMVQRFTPQSSSVHPLVLQFEDSSYSSEEEETDELTRDMVDSDSETQEHAVISTSAASLHPMMLQRSDELQHTYNQSTASRRFDEHMLLDSEEEEEEEDSEEIDGNSMEIEITGDLSDEADEVEDEDHRDELTHHVDNSTASPTTGSFNSSDDHGGSEESEMVREQSESGENGFLTPPPSSPGRNLLSKHVPLSTQSIQKEEIHVPTVPILHCSTSQVRLLASPAADSPHMFCARMLRQILPPDLERTQFTQLDRLNMIHQIPELGIVLVATQLGRCAVCTLTKRTQDSLLGFRVDWILPTKKQERQRARPASHALLGIASSPIQGHTVQVRRPMTHYDNDNEWTRDRVVSGTPVSFDPEILKLSPTVNEHLTNGDRSERHSNHTKSVSRERQWIKPSQLEGWRPHESSRRYRLMLTYTDLTVLTYELSRSVEKDDIVAQAVDRM